MTFRAPLFVGASNGGLGTDGVKPQDARLALTALAPGTGVLTGLTVAGVSGQANMTYTITAGAAALARGSITADGVYITANDGTVTVNSNTPAPASGSRYDLIYVQPRNAYDGGFGDSSSLPLTGVVVGTSGSSPAKPYGSVPAGALVLAEAQIPAGAASAAAGTVTITQVAPWAPGFMERSVSDWNAAMAPGFYFGALGAANAPDAVNGFAGYTVTNLGSYITQHVHRLNSFLDVYTRNSGDSGVTWTAWQRLFAGSVGWQPITVAANYTGGAAPNQPQAKLRGDYVDLSGYITRNAGPVQALATVGTLPSGNFAPMSNVRLPLFTYFNAASVNSALYLYIDAGTTTIQVAGNGDGYAVVNLTGIRYPVA